MRDKDFVSNGSNERLFEKFLSFYLRERDCQMLSLSNCFTLLLFFFFYFQIVSSIPTQIILDKRGTTTLDPPLILETFHPAYPYLAHREIPSIVALIIGSSPTINEFEGRKEKKLAIAE